MSHYHFYRLETKWKRSCKHSPLNVLCPVPIITYKSLFFAVEIHPSGENMLNEIIDILISSFNLFRLLSAREKYLHFKERVLLFKASELRTLTFKDRNLAT